MPWNTQGGGGGRGPWGQGPWDQGPQRPTGGPRGGGNLPPDLDDLIRRGQDRLRNLMPGGRLTILPVVVVLLAIYWLFHAIYTVQADEQGVVLRFGEYDRITNPGLHFLLWPVETVETPRALAENIMSFGISGDSRDPSAEGLMLAGDQNIVDIEFTVLWRIANPRDYLFNVKAPEELLRVVSESAMREYVGRSRAEEIRTKGRDAAQLAVQNLIQQTLDNYKAGIAITGVQLNKAEPPEPVMDAFAEVNRAQQDSAGAVNQANQYGFKRQGEANGEAAKIRQSADAYKGRVVAEAQGEAKRFESVYEQYRNAKDVTRTRLYIETMENVLSGASKIIIEQGAGGPGVVPYLPLPEIRPPSTPTASASQGGQQ